MKVVAHQQSPNQTVKGVTSMAIENDSNISACLINANSYLNQALALCTCMLDYRVIDTQGTNGTYEVFSLMHDQLIRIMGELEPVRDQLT